MMQTVAVTSKNGIGHPTPFSGFVMATPIIMKLEYESTLPELAEPHIRLFLRSDTFRKQRLNSSLVSGIVLIAFLYLTYSGPHSGIVLALSIIPFGFLIAAITYWAYKHIVAHRILKYVEREIADEIPAMASYAVESSQLVCRSAGVEITFSLDDIDQVNEENGYVELSFGKRGLCTIPSRVFDSDSHKSEFLSKISR